MPAADPKAVTFHAALQPLLREVDGYWAEVRSLLADFKMTNPEYGDYKDSCQALKHVMEAIWRLKIAWSDQP